MGVDMDKKCRDASCRVAFAALLHDIGKFAERGRVCADDPRLESHQQLYCPQRAGSGPQGRFTHIHAAYTGLVFDVIEQHLPELTADCDPFVPRQRAGKEPQGDGTATGEPDDSLVNAAARHHKPETFLQWMIACADRIASGFEREAWEAYNTAAEPKEKEGSTAPQAVGHYRARLLTLFEQIALQDEAGEGTKRRTEQDPRFRYPLSRLSPKALIPVPRDAAVPRTKADAQKEYVCLWEGFLEALKAIPATHRSDWALWLDHFDTLWLQFTHAIPAATAGNTKPEVSLYDHSKTTAALSVALWRYHHDRGDDPDDVAAKQKDRSDWDEKKFLLIQGDLFGIQRFIFAGGGESNRGAAKILRGRSAHVSLLAECAALKLLEALDLPPTSQIINAAGKFLIVAPNTSKARETVARVQKEIDAWFLKHGFGEAGLGIAMRAASPNDFVEKGCFRRIQQALVADLDIVKHQRFGLCGAEAPAAVFADAAFPYGVCAYQGRWPAEVKQRAEDKEPTISRLTCDQLQLGRILAQQRHLRLRIWRAGDGAEKDEVKTGEGEERLTVDLFGYRLAFAAIGDQEKARRDDRGPLPARVWDLSLPTGENAAPWHGLAWRAINAFVPVHDGDEKARDEREKLYELAGLAADDRGERNGGIRTFQELAGEALEPGKDDGQEADKARGVPALMVAKGDIDNLGRLFEKGLAQPTFAKWAALSRQANAFFTLYVPWLLRSRFPEIYTVFAGGDDFFFIGPWRQMCVFVTKLRADFLEYVARNPDIHFSLGLVMVKPQVPIETMARMAEEALDEKAKKYRGTDGLPDKNALCCFGEVISWGGSDEGEARAAARPTWPFLKERCQRLVALREKADFTSGYLYDLLRMIAMREKELRMIEQPGKEKPDLSAAGWRALLRYRTRRHVVDRLRRLDDDERAVLHTELVEEIGGNGIERCGPAYRIALFHHLYAHRGYRKGDRR